MKLLLKSGNAIDYPRTANDVTLAQYIVWHNEVKPTLPEEIVQYETLIQQKNEIEKELQRYYKQSGTKSPEALQQFLDSGRARDSTKRFVPPLLERWYEASGEMVVLDETFSDLWTSKNWHPYQLRTVQALMDAPNDLTVDELEYLFNRCTNAVLKPEKLTYKQLYQHGGIVYTLPDNLMSKSTLIEFAEAAQYEAALKRSQNGDANGLLNMCAVLLRPSGVGEYSEDVFEANCEAFQTLPLQVAYEVSFFLTWLSSKYALSLNRSTLQAMVKEMLD